MGFWSSTTASPTFWDVLGLGGGHTPRFLRTTQAPAPPLPSGLRIQRADVGNTGAVASFWRAYYRGADWSYDLTPGVMESVCAGYLKDVGVICLCLYDAHGELIATIMSTPIGKAMFGHGGVVENMRSVEGLCVHDRYRSKGIAGLMIGWIDHVTSASGNVVNLWSRELDVLPWYNTAAALHTYVYINSRAAMATVPFERVAWDAFATRWMANAARWATEHDRAIVATTPQNRRGDLHVFRSLDRIAVISNTRRVTRDGAAIYELVWCGTGDLKPCYDPSRFQQFLESVCAGGLCVGDRILFVGCGDGGGEWGTPWVTGKSGYHAWYIYNYIPPAFGSCVLNIMREEL